MIIGGINFIAVFIAAVVAFGFGAFWYTLLADPWMKAVGWSEEKIAYHRAHGPETRAPFAISFIAELVMAAVLAVMIGRLGPVTIWQGIVTGFLLWLGFVVTSMAVNHAFGGAQPMLTVLDGLHWLGVLVLQGTTIGAFGV